MSDHDAELRALLTRAADCEARRLSALQAQDWPRVAALEVELARLWRRHSDLEAQAERVA
jgi:hypothetical protein